MSIELTTTDSSPVEEIELFSIDGVSYTIPNKPRLNVALKTLKLANTVGQDAAMVYMMEAAIGEEAFEALLDYDDLDQETLQAIMAAAQKVVFGGLEGPKGK